MNTTKLEMSITDINKIKAFFKKDQFDLPANENGIIKLIEHENGQVATIQSNENDFAIATDEKPPRQGATEFRKSFKEKKTKKDNKKTDFLYFTQQFLLICELKNKEKKKAIDDAKQQFIDMKNPSIEKLKEDFETNNLKKRNLNNCKFVLFCKAKKNKRTRAERQETIPKVEFVPMKQLEIYVVHTLNENAGTIKAIIKEIENHA